MTVIAETKGNAHILRQADKFPGRVRPTEAFPVSCGIHVQYAVMFANNFQRGTGSGEYAWRVRILRSRKALSNKVEMSDYFRALLNHHIRQGFIVFHCQVLITAASFERLLKKFRFVIDDDVVHIMH